MARAYPVISTVALYIKHSLLLEHDSLHKTKFILELTILILGGGGGATGRQSWVLIRSDDPNLTKASTALLWVIRWDTWLGVFYIHCDVSKVQPRYICTFLFVFLMQ